MKENNNKTKDIVKKYDFKLFKGLGQNFLVDECVVDNIVEASDINEEDFVIEIGPGVGTLTKKLLDKSCTVTSIELDSRLIPILQEELSEYEKFNLVNEDILKVDLNSIIGSRKNVKVVANLPYYITTPIIIKLLKEFESIKTIVIMVQKEVADRIVSKENTKDYGTISLLAYYYCDVKKVVEVSKNSFIPAPKVDSTVIRLDRLVDKRVDVLDEKLFFQVIRESFGQRRKTLLNSLKNIGISKEKLIDALGALEINPQRRGETLSINEFANLSNEIYKRIRE